MARTQHRNPKPLRGLGKVCDVVSHERIRPANDRGLEHHLVIRVPALRPPRLGSQFIDEIRDRKGIRLLIQTRTKFLAYHSSGGSKELDGCRMARNRSESSIP